MDGERGTDKRAAFEQCRTAYCEVIALDWLAKAKLCCLAKAERGKPQIHFKPFFGEEFAHCTFGQSGKQEVSLWQTVQIFSLS